MNVIVIGCGDTGARLAELLAVVTENDNVNIMAAEVATRLFHVPHVVARLTSARFNCSASITSAAPRSSPRRLPTE